MQKICLNGKWNFKEANDTAFMQGTVPGCQYLDLIDNKILDDPFYGLNEQKSLWCAEKEWIYEKTFFLNDDFLNFNHVDLCFEQIDGPANVFLNGKHVLFAENTYLTYEIDAKEHLRAGENVIKVQFLALIPYVNQKQAADKLPKVQNTGIGGTPHLRKPLYHFGWDWGPNLPPVGLSGDVYISAYDAKLKDLCIKQKHIGGKVELDISCEVVGNGGVRFEVYCPEGNLLTKNDSINLNQQFSIFNIQYSIKNPQLWWVHELNPQKTQPLYTIKAVFIDNTNTIHDSRFTIHDIELVKKIGLRTIELDRKPDRFGEQFKFILNGVPLFIKGANWIPADSFTTRVSEQKLRSLLNSAKFSNMNMIRVWGGGYYESDLFYDICDELGMLVWQDFMFCCMPAPFYNDNYLNNVMREVEQNVKRLRHRASLALWCGNNEIEGMMIGWRLRFKLVKWVEKFFYNILPREFVNYDDVTPYVQGSPVGTAFGKGIRSANNGDKHIWKVWHGLKPLNYYDRVYTRFCSEFGFESLPNMATLLSFAPPENLKLKGAELDAHQKCAGGNSKMLYYISTRFLMPKWFNDLVYLSQLMQENSIRLATEHWRRYRGRCNGAIYWQFNDCWPVTSWSSIDYFGRYKALQYTARHFNQPLTVCIDAKKSNFSLFVFNDLDKPFAGSCEYSLITFDGKEVYKKTVDATCPATSSNVILPKTSFKKLLKQNKFRCVLSVKLFSDSGNLIAEKTHLFKAEARLKLPKAVIASKAKTENCQLSTVNLNNTTVNLTLSSDKFARCVKIEVKDTNLEFSDNYFDLLPNQTKVVTFNLPQGKSLADIQQGLCVMSLSDVEFKGNALTGFLKRIGYSLLPANFLSWLGHLFM
jgi:beta-mannosidase